MHVRIKFCGITRPEDAAAAAAAGADAIGLVFYPDSPRCVTPRQAALICAAVPPFVSRVGLFVDPEREWVKEVLKMVPLDLLQFHGTEPVSLCTSFGRPYLKGVRVRETRDIVRADKEHGPAQALLLDAYVAGKHGGTGVPFSWALIPAGIVHPVILAGGLTPENVGAAIAAARPFAVDVSGGIENQPGIKDSGKMCRFAAAVLKAAN
ncbi:MAG: N-(5'-phosphoribosyl)anthranilate isomerase [Gammaproteobacteria bacterium RIFCSPLOWO2_02_FULL_61_13]|nr:MAG: N-(5'-phosphoribosyl)anthranilate isomerase [Gammaproteobacteria bacterium RIFCSPLOWO2_02_FULL_61_13]